MAETRRPTAEQEGAFQTVEGNWKAFLRNGEEITVRPLKPENIAEILGAISLGVAEKERRVAGELGMAKPEDDAELIERGKAAKGAVLESQQAVVGEKELLNQLRAAVLDGIMSKTPSIFWADRATAKFVAGRYPLENRGTQLDVSASGGSDMTSEGIQYCLLLTPEKGAEIKDVFERNGHRVYEHPAGDGFQAEMGGLRIAFIYPRGEVALAEERSAGSGDARAAA